MECYRLTDNQECKKGGWPGNGKSLIRDTPTEGLSGDSEAWQDGQNLDLELIQHLACHLLEYLSKAAGIFLTSL